MQTQVCKKCKIEKPLIEYKIEKRVKSGYEVTCISCNKEKARLRRINNHEKYLAKEAEKRKSPEYIQYHTDYYSENKEQLNNQGRENYYKNPEPYLKRSKEQKLRWGDKYKQYQKEYRIKNREKLNLYIVNRLKNDVCFRLKHYLRGAILKGIKGKIRKSRTIDYIGCSFEMLKEHLEKQFKPEMSWENQGKYWHVDHIIPCRAFNFSIDEQVKKCFHYTNLQPLEASVNYSKQDVMPDGTRARDIYAN